MESARPSEPWDVFCIHSSADADPARRFHDALAADHRVFLDDVTLVAGSSWQQELDAALQASRVFAVLVSSNLDRAFYAQAEIATAVALHRRYPTERRIVPVLLEPKGDIVSQMPYDLRGIKGVEMAGAGGLERVAQHVRQTLGSIGNGTAAAGSASNSAGPKPEPKHVLEQYPRAPLVPSHKIPASIKQAYATLIRVREARQVIDDANAFRQEADPSDASVTLIKQFRLRSPEDNAPIDFWTDAFSEAGKHGPRMLAALLLVFEDDQFPDRTRQERQALLEYLRQPA